MTTAAMPRSLALPSSRTVINLALGGFAGLGFWELFSAVPTAWVAGFPLEPPELVKALFYHQLGLQLSTPVAKLLHFVTGFLFYPMAYWVLTRWVKSFGMPADGWIWGVITYFIALGFFAPLGGQHFLLNDVPLLSLMSLIGHAIYGWLAAYVFEALEARSA
ncbi:MAG: hypothetical protein ACTHP8_19025 [Bosea sp. (in: a-proteobacteria)]|uniref:hypothetical protein n=1 Tax=unclassified Bosea (in: a-proteobacteria) TaxID=2653178 RepID=UPI0009603EEB|nr:MULTISPECIES: hypothetical protein [unclassified Bosea (in: a-proteobacteria)]MBN9442018.1 hypothetical protein [Bosea sp. (in: a-proteobacteria)]MBN9455454.1 hypothetical protein [Bosea sp. (in: a-proteobacteria)]OJV05054.1 MAG: hypothetical protein BGO20_18165 [Bosea sp. 67-29]